jgi:hypothetical protein
MGGTATSCVGGTMCARVKRRRLRVDWLMRSPNDGVQALAASAESNVTDFMARQCLTHLVRQVASTVH